MTDTPRFDPCGRRFQGDDGNPICKGDYRCPACLEIRRLRAIEQSLTLALQSAGLADECETTEGTVIRLIDRIAELEAQLETRTEERHRQANLFARLRGAMGWQGEEPDELVNAAMDLREKVGELEAQLAERDATIEQLRDEAADYDHAILKQFDEAAAGSTDLFTWITCKLAERDADAERPKHAFVWPLGPAEMWMKAQQSRDETAAATWALAAIQEQTRIDSAGADRWPL